MRKKDAFRMYGIELPNPLWTSSGVRDDPREVVLSLWKHGFNDDMSRYETGTAGWSGGGKPIMYRHLRLAMEEGLPIRVVVADTDDRDEIYLGNATRTDNDFEPDFELVGRVLRLEENEFELAFERTGQAPGALSAPAPSSAKYWHVAEAVEALGGPSSTAQIKDWLDHHYPGENHSDLSQNLRHLTVNDANRRHFDKSRKVWRTDMGHPRDRLFRRGRMRSTTYEPFRPATHGHWDLQPGADGVWSAVPLPSSTLGRAEDEAQDQAFEHLPALDSDHDGRVWAMSAIVHRRGQGAFRAQLLEAYDGRCAITGCSAVAVLEAAHIKPYRGEHTHRVDNGLLLRADVHTLFDLGLIWITDQNAVHVVDSLRGTEYEGFHGQPLRLPTRPDQHPNPAHLAEHGRLAQEKQS